jgi:hypothetical protein
LKINEKMAKLFASLLALAAVVAAEPIAIARREPSTTLDGLNAAAASSSCTPLTTSNPTQWWYANITHNGESSYLSSDLKDGYTVFRNVVTDFGADNTGGSDASAAIQKAINGSVASN